MIVNDDITKGKEVLSMGVQAKPVKVTFAVKADKAKEFRNIKDTKPIREIQKEAKKIKNITITDLVYDEK